MIYPESVNKLQLMYTHSFSKIYTEDDLKAAEIALSFTEKFKVKEYQSTFTPSLKYNENLKVFEYLPFTFPEL